MRFKLLGFATAALLFAANSVLGYAPQGASEHQIMAQSLDRVKLEDHENEKRKKQIEEEKAKGGQKKKEVQSRPN